MPADYSPIRVLKEGIEQRGELELDLIQTQMANNTETDAAGRSVRACDAHKSQL